MKQTTTEVINKLTIEYNELAGRIGSLERFLISEDYQEVTQIQKSMLTEQHSEMEFYKRTLMKRLVDLRSQEKREKAMTCDPTEEARPEAESGTPAD